MVISFILIEFLLSAWFKNTLFWVTLVWIVIPACFWRESREALGWIPAKNMRE